MTSRTENESKRIFQNEVLTFKSIIGAIVFFVLGVITPPAYRNAIWRDSFTISQVRNSSLLLQDNIVCSEESLQDFIHDQPLQGFHIFCFENGHKSQVKVTAYAEATRSKKVSWGPEQSTWDSFEKKLFSIMSSKGKENSKWAFFTPNGRPIMGASSMKKNAPPSLQNFMLNRIASENMVILIEGGMWFWPAVHIGFRRKILLRDDNVSHARAATLETLSVDPVVLSVEGFLSMEESDYIQKIAGPKVQHSSTVAKQDGDKDKKDSDFRTSQTAFIRSKEYPMLQDLEDRTSVLTRTPLQHQEDYQILKYSLGQRYDAHLDYFDMSKYQKDTNTQMLTKNGKQNRFATVFFYLSDVEKGGETVFPRFNRAPQPYDMKDCTKGLKVKPQKGKVIIFYSLLPNGDYNPYSLHGACPVEEGIKWAGNKWIWNAPINHINHDK